jgi:lambda repressor-like predicted transcriptional regulator
MHKYNYINELIKYMNKTGTNYAEVARRTGVSNFSIINIVKGKSKKPGKLITDKLDRFFDDLHADNKNIHQ